MELLSQAATICSGFGSPPSSEFCSDLEQWLQVRIGNFSNTTAEPTPLSQRASALTVVLTLLILITILGNLFVISATILERNLHSVANYLIVSLAIADLMVACLVMPLGAVYEINQGWILGPELCDIWTSFDVLCCTASILHLVAIAVDRYWAVTEVDYIRNRKSTRIISMIVLVWSMALAVSLAPQFGWKDPGYLERITQQQRCLVSQDIGYQIFATCSTFYIPLLVILILYWKIYQTARTRIRRRIQAAPCKTKPTKLNMGLRQEEYKGTGVGGSETKGEYAFTICKPTRYRSRESVEAKRERKAAKTLVIITGAFVMCWLPFFSTALLLPLCSSCQLSDALASLFLWLGYFNSALNPIIYTIFSPEFRNAFRRILRRDNHPRR